MSLEKFVEMLLEEGRGELDVSFGIPGVFYCISLDSLEYTMHRMPIRSSGSIRELGWYVNESNSLL